MHHKDRWNLIIEEVGSTALASIHELSAKVSASKRTLQRDLADLDRLGMLSRVRGGARKVLPESARHPAANVRKPAPQPQPAAGSPFSSRQIAIATTAASLVEPHSSIILAGDGPSRALASELGRVPCRVLTQSIATLKYLMAKPELQLTLPEGEIDRGLDLVLSPYDAGIVRHFSASKIFISPQALTHDGLMQSHPLIVQSERMLLERAKEVIVLAESQIVNSTGHYCVWPIRKIDLIITDSDISPRALDAFVAQGTRVLIARLNRKKPAEDNQLP